MIWCVEDDASIRDIELYALTSTGFEARGFDDGASFWEALQTETPELVLLDVMLPGEDGVSLLKRMKTVPAPRLSVLSDRTFTELHSAERTGRIRPHFQSAIQADHNRGSGDTLPY